MTIGDSILIYSVYLQAHDVSSGYGFTVYLCHTGSGNVVYGTGINTDSQLGYQEYPPNSGWSSVMGNRGDMIAIMI